MCNDVLSFFCAHFFSSSNSESAVSFKLCSHPMNSSIESFTTAVVVSMVVCTRSFTCTCVVGLTRRDCKEGCLRCRCRTACGQVKPPPHRGTRAGSGVVEARTCASATSVAESAMVICLRRGMWKRRRKIDSRRVGDEKEERHTEHIAKQRQTVLRDLQHVREELVDHGRTHVQPLRGRRGAARGRRLWAG